MKYRVLLCAASALVLGGCMGSSEVKKDSRVGYETASGEDVPDSLKDKSQFGMAGNGTDASLLNPLEKELKYLRIQESKLRQELAQYNQKRDEYKLRAQELDNRLAAAQQRIKKVNTVMQMIDKDPALLNGINNANLGSSSNGLDVPSISDNGPLSNDMPALSSGNNTLGGGPEMPSLAPTFGSNAAPRNELSSSGSNLPGFASGKSQAGNFEVAPTFPVSAVDEPVLDERAPGAVWKNNSMPSLKQSAKILVCEGKGVDSQIIISLGRKDGITPGMLFEAAGSDGGKNVLVVTNVYDTNAEAKLHPRFSAGGVSKGLAIKKLDVLPR